MSLTTPWRLLVFVGSAFQPFVATADDLTNVVERPSVEPFSETVFELKIDDPYRWMERPDRQDDVSGWIRSASAHFSEELASIPGRQRIAERLESLYRASVGYSSVRKAGDKTFFLRLDVESDIPALVVRDQKGHEKILFDPATESSEGAPPTAINSYSPSPSGGLVAFHTAQGGSEVGAVRFMDVASGDILEDRLEPIWGEFPVGWLDENTVLYTQMSTAQTADQLAGMMLKLHTLGDPAKSDVIIFSPDGPQPFAIEPQEFPWVFPSSNPRWVIGGVGGARPDFRVVAIERASLLADERSWIEVGNYDDRINGIGLIGDDLFLLTTKNESSGEVIRVNLDSPDPDNATIVLPAGELVVNGLEANKDGIYVTAIDGGANRLLYLRNARGNPKIVELPFAGSIDDVSPSADGSQITFSAEGWLQNNSYFEAIDGKVAPIGLSADTHSAAGAFEAIDETATSQDGTTVPLTILLPRSGVGDGGVPAYLYAYGSYGISLLPWYSRNFLAWLEEGGIVAVCHTRGGGERGRAWHEAGREANKPKAQADLIACGERLVDLGLTGPDLLGVAGGSAAGLLIPPAALQRPDVFKAVILAVGAMNSTRLGVAENGANQFAEMGDPNTAEGFRALYEQDSYHWLSRVPESPDWLLTVGLNDRRVEPWMSAKFAARALSRFGERNIIAIRTDADAGHGIGSTRVQIIQEAADIYTFLLNRFGVEDFQMQPTD